MQCPGCHKNVPDDSKFCAYCGVAMDAKTLVTKPTADAPSPEPAPGVPTRGSAAFDPVHEKPVREFRPAWRAFLGGWVIWALASAVMIYLAARFQASSGAWNVIWIAIALGALLALARQVWCVLGIRYRLTTQRLFVERGLLSRTTDQTELVRIDDVRVTRGIIDRLLGLGRVDLVSTDATDKALRIIGAEQPMAIAEDIRVHTRRMRSRQTMFIESI